MVSAGGIADKVGNRYERRWTLNCLLDLLDDSATSLRAETPGVDSFEFYLKRADKTEWHQVKRQRAAGSWTVQAMKKEGILGAFWEKLRQHDEVHFISQDRVYELMDLIECATQAITGEEFAQIHLATQDRNIVFNRLLEAWSADRDSAYQKLRHVVVDIISEPLLVKFNENKIRATLRGTPGVITGVLNQYLDDFVGQEHTADKVKEYLASFGIVPLSSPPPTSSVVGRLPIVSRSLIDRIACVAVMNSAVLNSYDGGVLIVAGKSGVGKSQIAATYAKTALMGGPARVCWLDGSSESSIMLGFADVGTNLGLAISDDRDRAVEAMNVLNRFDSTRTLLIIDGVERDAEALPWIPTTGSVGTLITTTRQDLLPQADRVSVGHFTRDESLQLFCQRTSFDTDKYADRLAALLGDLPLAVSQAAAGVIEWGSYKEYERQLREQMVPTSPKVGQEGIELIAAVAITAALSPAKDRSAVEFELYKLAVIDNPVGPEIFGLIAPQVQTIADDLIQSSVLVRSDTGEISLHALTAGAFRRALQRSPDRLSVVYNVARFLGFCTFPESEGWERRDESRWIVASIESTWRFLVEGSLNVAGKAAINKFQPLARWAVWQSRIAEDLQTSLEFGGHLLRDSESYLGRSNPSTMMARHDLATMNRRAGHPAESERLHRKNLQERRRYLGEKDVETLTSWNNLGVALIDLDLGNDAVACLDEATRLRREVLGGHHYLTLTSELMRSHALLLTDRREHAVSDILDVLSRISLNRGPLNPFVLHARHMLADTYMALGRTAEAVEIGQDVLLKRSGVLGRNDLETIHTAFNLSKALQANGQLDRASSLLRGVVRARTELLGTTHPSTLEATELLQSNKRMDILYPVAKQNTLSW